MRRYLISLICFTAIASASQETATYMMAINTQDKQEAQIIKDYFAAETCKPDGYLDKSIVEIKQFQNSSIHARLIALKSDEYTYRMTLSQVKSKYCY